MAREYKHTKEEAPTDTGEAMPTDTTTETEALKARIAELEAANEELCLRIDQIDRAYPATFVEPVEADARVVRDNMVEAPSRTEDAMMILVRSLMAMDGRATAQGHSLAAVLNKAAEAFFGIKIA